MRKILVTKESLGSKYPFNVSPIFLSKDSIGGLYVNHKGKKYNLNGVAKKGKPLDSIWVDNILIHGTKKPINVMFDICRDKGLI